jgi:hypothetical protein
MHGGDEKCILNFGQFEGKRDYLEDLGVFESIISAWILKK